MPTWTKMLYENNSEKLSAYSVGSILMQFIWLCLFSAYKYFSIYY